MPAVFTIVCVGAKAVGKSALLEKYLTGSVAEAYKPDVGLSVRATDCDVGQQSTRVQFVDVSGAALDASQLRDKLRSLSVRAAAVCGIVDGTRPETLATVRDFLTSLRGDSSFGSVIALAANKIDAPGCDTAACAALAQDFDALMYETSAQTGENVFSFFSTIISAVAWRMQKGTLALPSPPDNPVVLRAWGRLGDPDTQRARVVGEYLAHEYANVSFELKALTPSEWDLENPRLRQEISATAAPRSLGVLVVANGAFVGGGDAFLRYAVERFAYVDNPQAEALYNPSARNELRQYMSSSRHSFVKLSFSNGTDVLGDVTLELFDDRCPTFAHEFVENAVGGKLADTRVCRVVDSGFMQLHAPALEPSTAKLAECLDIHHDRMGVFGLLTDSRECKAAHMYFSLAALPWMTGRYQALGRVFDGLRVLKLIAQIDRVNESPVSNVRITSAALFKP